MTNRILLTGASGFVGSYLLSAMVQKWPSATILALGSKKDSIANEQILHVDMLDAMSINKIMKDFSPDLIIHLASQASVAAGNGIGQDSTWRVNLNGSLNIALAVANFAPTATVFFVSSSEVYGLSFLAGPVHEESLAIPNSAYARSKLLAERMFAAVLPYETRLVVIRPFSHTGPGQREIYVLPSFAAQVARIEAGIQSAQLYVGNLNIRRDFLDIRDVVRAYILILEAIPRLPQRFTCNISSGQTYLLRDIIDSLHKQASVKFEIVVDVNRTRNTDVPVVQGDSALIKALTGWMPLITIDETLQTLVAYAQVSTQKSVNKKD